MDKRDFPTLCAFGINAGEIEEAGEICRKALDDAGLSTQDVDVFFSESFDQLISKIKETDKTVLDTKTYDLTSFAVSSMYEQCAEYLNEQGVQAVFIPRENSNSKHRLEIINEESKTVQDSTRSGTAETVKAEHNLETQER